MNIFRDIKFIARLFIKYPGSSLLGIGVLGLGLGLSITAFSLVNGIVWSSPAVEDGRRLLHLQWISDQSSDNFKSSFRGAEVKAIQQQVQHLDTIAFYNLRMIATYRPRIGMPTLRYGAAGVGPGFFQLLQVRPLLGRVPVEKDMLIESDRVVVISYELWQTYFAGLPNAIGKSLELNGWPHTVIGVMPAGFHLPSNNQLWFAARGWVDARGRIFEIISTLKPGRTEMQARLELSQIANRLVQDQPESLKGRSRILVMPFNASLLTAGLKTTLLFLSTIALLVFVIACANISSLLMTRVSLRQQELVIRKTLGADCKHIVMQVMLEALLFALGGLILGFQLYVLAAESIWGWMQNNFGSIPHWWHMQVDWVVYSFGGLAVLLSTLVSSLIPALRAASKPADSILKDNSRTGSGLFVGRVTKVLVAIQIMCATVLSVMALTTILVTHYLRDRGLPYNPEQILTVRYHLSSSFSFGSDFKETNKAIIQFYNQLMTSLQELPNIDSVGIASNISGVRRQTRRFEIAGDKTTQQENTAYTGANIVSNGYFSVFDMQPLQGRLFLPTDTVSAEKIAVVNEHFVNAFLGGSSPLGRRVRVERPGAVNEITNNRSPVTDWMTIVGVVPNIQRRLWPGESSKDLAAIYIPVQQRVARIVSVLLKSRGDVTRWIEPMRRMIHKQAPSIAPVSNFETVSRVLNGEIDRQSILTHVVVVFACIALFIATAGLYGLISFTVLLRRREFGIRLALGAGGVQVFILVFTRALWLLSLSLALGLGIAFSINNTIKQSLGGINFPVEVPSNVIGISLVVVASVIAVIIPAIQAIQVPPNEALRMD